MRDPESFKTKEEIEEYFNSQEFKDSSARLDQQVKEMKRHALEDEIEFPREEITKKLWTAFGLQCAIVMGPFSMNGYVRVSFDHPDAGKYTDDNPIVDLNVHGGITFTCKTKEGRWFGFDTAHYCDDNTQFGMPYHGFRAEGKHVWNEEAVVHETEQLARQLAELGGKKFDSARVEALKRELVK